MFILLEIELTLILLFLIIWGFFSFKLKNKEFVSKSITKLL